MKLKNGDHEKLLWSASCWTVLWDFRELIMMSNFNANGLISFKLCADLCNNNLLFPYACLEQRSTLCLLSI